MRVKFTIPLSSTSVLTFPKSVVSFKVMDKIFRRGSITCWVVVCWSTGSNTGAKGAKDIRHELVTGFIITRKEIFDFLCCKHAFWKIKGMIIIISPFSVPLNQFCKGAQLQCSCIWTGRTEKFLSVNGGQ